MSCMLGWGFLAPEAGLERDGMIPSAELGVNLVVRIKLARCCNSLPNRLLCLSGKSHTSCPNHVLLTGHYEKNFGYICWREAFDPNTSGEGPSS